MGRSAWIARLAAVLCGTLLVAPLAACSLGARNAAVESSPPAPAPDASVAGAPSAAPAASPSYGAVSPKSADLARTPAAAASTTDRMVIRSGTVRLEVPKVTSTVTALRALAARYGGVVSNLQLSSDSGNPTPEPLPQGAPARTQPSGLPFSASVTLQVPVAKMDAFRGDVEKLGKVVSEQADDQDVTQQHVDLAARLANAKAEEARLRSFFDSAKSVTDMLSIERELARVRGDIESMTAELATLERQAAMATLTVELVEPKPLVRPAGMDWGFGGAITAGIQGLAGILQGLIVLAIGGLPLWLGIVAAFFLIRWRIRVVRARAEKTTAV